MNDKIAIYLRLSLADGDLKKGSKDESNSIENQRMLLHDYIGKQEDLFGEIVEYVDAAVLHRGSSAQVFHWSYPCRCRQMWQRG